MSIAEKTIAQRVTDVIVEVLRVDKNSITPDSRIREDLGADSLDTVSLLMALEEEFNGSISDEEAETLTTAGKIIDFISAQAGEGRN